MTKAFVRQFSLDLRSDFHGTGVRVTFDRARYGRDPSSLWCVPIACKDYPAWRLELQIKPYEDAARYRYRFDPFDITKVWPHRDYPTIPVGRMVLDRNPENSM